MNHEQLNITNRTNLPMGSVLEMALHVVNNRRDDSGNNPYRLAFFGWEKVLCFTSRDEETDTLRFVLLNEGSDPVYLS